MTEIIFALTVIYAGYVIFVTMTDKKEPVIHSIDDSAEALFSVPHHHTTHHEPEKIVDISENTTPLTPSDVVKMKGLKNPETGEITTNYGNYRFMKRWIKEALVKENLLDKIYKNNELTAEVETVIKTAVERLEALERYQV